MCVCYVCSLCCLQPRTVVHLWKRCESFEWLQFAVWLQASENSVPACGGFRVQSSRCPQWSSLWLQHTHAGRSAARGTEFTFLVLFALHVPHDHCLKLPESLAAHTSSRRIHILNDILGHIMRAHLFIRTEKWIKDTFCCKARWQSKWVTERGRGKENVIFRFVITKSDGDKKRRMITVLCVMRDGGDNFSSFHFLCTCDCDGCTSHQQKWPLLRQRRRQSHCTPPSLA